LKFEQQLGRVAAFGRAEQLERLGPANELAKCDFARGGRRAFGSYPIGFIGPFAAGISNSFLRASRTGA
jgi:hypothetical protein